MAIAPETEPLITALAQLQANQYALYSIAHGFHWNVKGNFDTLHSIFKETYLALLNAMDKTSETIRQLGAMANTNFLEMWNASDFEPQSELLNSRQMVDFLIDAHRQSETQVKAIATIAAQTNDQATINLMAEFQAYHRDQVWRLSSQTVV